MTLFEQHDEGKVIKTDKVTRPANTAAHEEMFLELLERTFGEQKVQDYQKLYPSDLHQIFQNFEAKKCTFRFKETKDKDSITRQFCQFRERFSLSIHETLQ